MFPHCLKKARFSGKSYWPLWLSIQYLSETFLILRRIERVCSRMYIGLHVQYPLFLPDFNKTLIFLTDFPKVLKYQISWKSVQWEPNCSMRNNGRTDRCTDMTKLIIAFRNNANLPKNCAFFPQRIYVFCIYLRTATFALFNINWLIFITEMKVFIARCESGL